jgi:transcriptional regulator with XRE-family HTH domain
MGEAIGITIYRLRQQHNMTQAELAQRAGTRQEYISRLETGARRPGLAMMRRLAMALGVSLYAMIVELAQSEEEGQNESGTGTAKQAL